MDRQPMDCKGGLGLWRWINDRVSANLFLFGGRMRLGIYPKPIARIPCEGYFVERREIVSLVGRAWVPEGFVVEMVRSVVSRGLLLFSFISRWTLYFIVYCAQYLALDVCTGSHGLKMAIWNIVWGGL